MCSDSKPISARARSGAYLVASNPAQLPVVDQIFRALAPLKLVRGDNEARGGADLEGLSKLGMPIIEPGLDGTNYFDVHHTANDTLAQVDPQALAPISGGIRRERLARRAVFRLLGTRDDADKPPRR